MLAAAARRVLVADSTKFGWRAAATVSAVHTFDMIGTDDELDARGAAACGGHLVQVTPTSRTHPVSSGDDGSGG